MTLRNFKEHVYSTIHGNKKKTPKQIAGEIGVSYGYLMRWPLEPPSGCNTPSELLIPLMKATKDYSILRYIARRCGFLLIKPPRGWKGKSNYHFSINEYQKGFLKVIEALISFFSDPNIDRRKHLNELLCDHIEQTCTWKKRAEKDIHQTEMDFNL